MKYFIAVNMNGLPVIMTNADCTPMLFDIHEDAEEKAFKHDACRKLGYEIYLWILGE